MCIPDSPCPMALKLCCHLQPLSSLACRLRRDSSSRLMKPRFYRVAQNSDRGLMRSRRFEWHGCVAPIPKAACTGFQEVRGEFFAHPTGCCEMSRRRQASHIWRRREGTARYNRAEAVVSDTGSNQFSKTGGHNRADGYGKPFARVQRICRPLVSVFLWRVMASAARYELRLGVGPIPAIAR